MLKDLLKMTELNTEKDDFKTIVLKGLGEGIMESVFWTGVYVTVQGIYKTLKK